MSDFIAGKYKKQLSNTGYGYESFLPAEINKSYNWADSEVDTLLEEASNNLSRLNTFAVKTPDIDFFIKMHVAKEATTSSKIEGTQTKMEEVFMDEDELVPEKRDDWEEVQNYLEAMSWSIKKLDELPLSMRLIKGAHELLMSGVRGEDKRPGEIRESQNWIGGKNIENATFIPPHPNDLPDLLTDLEKFWNNDDLDLPRLIRAGLSHYQFETIHPFLDGNGRIGRLIITLYLLKEGILDKPVLYLSDFFVRKRSEYFQSLSRVREDNDMDQWLKFFLRGVIETSEKGVDTLEKVVSLKREYMNTIDQKIGSRRQDSARDALFYLFSDPHVSVGDVAEELGVTFPTADALLGDMEGAGIVKEVTGRKRDRRFELVDYIKVFKE